MKKEFLLITLFILFATGISYAQTNLLSDPGFEDGTYYGPDNNQLARIYEFTDIGIKETQTGNPTMAAETIVKNKWYRKCLGNSGYVSSQVIETDKYEGTKSVKIRISQKYSSGGFTNKWDANALMQYVDIDRTKEYQIKFYAKNTLNCDSLFVGLVAAGKIVEGSGWIYNITNEWAEYTIDVNPALNESYTDDEFAKTAVVISQASSMNEENKTAQNVEVLIDNVQLIEKENVEPELPDVVLTGKELINDNNFDLNVLLTTAKDPEEDESGVKKGYWFNKKQSENVIVSIINLEDADRGNVAKLERVGTVSWYNGFIGHWSAGTAKREYYRLTFKAKRESGNGKLRSHIKVGGSQNFVILKDGENINYSAQTDTELTDQWAEYHIDYDFNTVVNTLYATNKTFTEITDDQLANFFVAFYPHADGTVILIDDVSLKPHRFVDPAPEDGDLLLDTDFESLTEIPRRTTKDDDKFSDEMGEWYFYAEPGLNGIDDSKAELKEDDIYGKVVALTNGSTLPSWWGHTLLQRFAAKPQPAIYRVSFYAKSNSTNAKAFVMINTKLPNEDKAEYVLVEGFNPVATPKSSGARYEITTSSEWQYYECNFDFSQKCNNYNSPQGVGEGYAITDMTDDFLGFCYFAIFNNTGSSELLLDNINIELIDTYTEMRNPGFETNDALPVKVTSDLNLGAHSGQWVLVAKNEDKGNVSVSSAQANSGEKSMQLDVTELTNRARYSFYMVMDIYEVEAKDYEFKFHSKADKADVPFRLDVYAYNGEEAQAITGVNGENLVTDGVAESAAGLKIFNTATDWTAYSQRMTIPENTLVRIFIRPNITGLGSHGPLADSYPVTYWFDDFELVEAQPLVGLDNFESSISTYSKDGVLYINNLENANVSIYNTTGQLINTSNNVTGSANYSLEKGIYIIKVNSGLLPVQVKVLVK